MTKNFRLILLGISLITQYGCVAINKTPEVKLDSTPTLEKFEGVYWSSNSKLLSLFWPHTEDDPLVRVRKIDIRFITPNSLMIRAYGNAQQAILLKEGVIREGEDFLFKDGVLTNPDWGKEKFVGITENAQNIFFVTGVTTTNWDSAAFIPIFFYERKANIFSYARVSKSPVKKAASRSGPTLKSTDGRPKSVLHPDCQVSNQTIESIKNFKKTFAENLSTNSHALKLLEEAEAAAKPPECDNIRAKILTDKAHQIIIKSHQ